MLPHAGSDNSWTWPISGSQLLFVQSQGNGGSQGTEAGCVAAWTAVNGLVLTAELVAVQEQNPRSTFMVYLVQPDP